MDIVYLERNKRLVVNWFHSTHKVAIRNVARSSTLSQDLNVTGFVCKNFSTESSNRFAVSSASELFDTSLSGRAAACLHCMSA